MSLTKTLATISAGALMMIGHSAVAQESPPQDRGVDRTTQVHTQTGDERTGPVTRTRSPVWDEADDDEVDDEDVVAQEDGLEDEFVAQEDEFVAEDDTFVQDDEVGVRDDQFIAQEDEFRTDEFATEEEFTAQERGVATDTHVYDRTEAGVDTHTTIAGQELCPCPPAGQVGVDWHVDETRLRTLARINSEMLDETRELADRLAATQDAGEAQRLQLQLLERQMDVIQRHGWSHEEYNAVVMHIHEDEELRDSYIDTVVAGEFETDDETVAGEFDTGLEDDRQLDDGALVADERR